MVIMKTIDNVINRVFNCKFTSAYEDLKTIEGIDKETLKLFKEASYDLGNCGWGGKLIEKRADSLAKKLGYVFSEEEDYFTKE